MWQNNYEQLASKLQNLADEFGRSLQDFINRLEFDRALFWEASLHGFLRDWRQRGILVDDKEYQRLCKLLGELREKLVPADELRDATACLQRQIADVQAHPGEIQLGEPNSPEEAALPPGVRRLGHGIMRRHAPERWMEVVEDVLASWRFAEGVGSKFRAWMTVEADSKSAEAASFTQPSVQSALDDAKTAQLQGLGEAIMQQYPPEQWLAEAENRAKALRISNETQRQFLEWIEAEKYWRLLPKQVALGTGDGSVRSDSAAYWAEFKAGFIEGFTDGLQQSAAAAGYLAGLLARIKIASNPFASLVYTAIFNAAPLDAEMRLMRAAGIFGSDLFQSSNWQTGMLMTMGSAAVVAEIERVTEALTAIKPVLELVRSAVSDQNPRAQGKIVGWVTYQAVEAAVTAGAAEAAKPGALANLYRKLLASPAVRENATMVKVIEAALNESTAGRAPPFAAPSKAARWTAQELVSAPPGAARPNVLFTYVDDLLKREERRLGAYSRAKGIEIQSGLPPLVELGALRHEYGHMILSTTTRGAADVTYIVSNYARIAEEFGVHLYATQSLSKAVQFASRYANVPHLVIETSVYGGTAYYVFWREDK